MSPTITAARRPDLDAITAAALEAEGPPVIQGVRPLTPDRARLQRRVTLIWTVAPLVGVLAAMVVLWRNGLSALDLAIFATLYVFTTVGVTVGYHRLFTHRSFDTPAPVRAVLAIAGSMSLQGAVIEWVAIHRRHHAFADAYGDPHSPHLETASGLRGTLRGLYHAHVGWLFKTEYTEPSRWAPDLLEDPVLVRVNRAFPFLTVTSIVLPAIIGGVVTGTFGGALSAFLWGSVVRIFLLHHITWSINSICHFFGERPFDARDESTNNWPLSLLSFGESWHNNHHAFPSSARHGILRGQIDLSWRVIRTLELLGLARNVRRVTAAMLARRWAGRPQRLARG